MKFLFEITAYSLNTPVTYKVSRVNDYDFIAETSDANMQSFTITKQDGSWICESGYTYDLALRISRKIDKLRLDRYKKVQNFFRSFLKPAAGSGVAPSGNMVKQLAQTP